MKIKIAAFATTLVLSGAGVAQSAPDTVTPAPGTTATMAVPDSAAPGGMTTVSVTTPASGNVIQPDNQNPRRDSNGVAVRSGSAVVPNGWNGVSGSAAMGGPLGGVPVCSARVTDHCRESYSQTYTGR